MVAQIDNRFRSLSFKKTYTRLLSYVFYEGRPLTTKGRWINPLLLGLFKIQSVLPFAKAIHKPVFILGTGRSGTTILGVTLGIHKDAGFLNEPKLIWSYLYDSEDLIGSYQTKPASYRLDANQVTDEIIKKAHRVLGHYLNFSLSTRVIDKYPELIFRTEFVKKIFPDAKFLFLYRNGYDTCHSINNWSKRLGVTINNETHDWWGLNNRKWHLLCDQIVAYDEALGPHLNIIKKYTDHELRAAVEWIVTMKEGIKLLSESPESVMGVQYEKYVSDPDFRQQVLQFCDLNEDSNFTDFTNIVLKEVQPRQKISFPSEIEGEFCNVMTKLGYE
ncbi:MAG: sulfotransferase [Candidatus Thiodiazotropha sp.]